MKRQARHNQRGSVLVEFSIAAFVFFVALFSVLEIARLLWTYNALADGVRQGARFATMNAPNSTTAVKNVVMYGTAAPAQNATPIVNGLTASHITVAYNSMGVRLGTVTVSLNNFSFQFLTLPSVLGTSLTLPNYSVTLTGESAGCEPTSADPNPCD